MDQSQRSKNLMTICIDGLRKFGPLLLTEFMNTLETNYAKG